MKNGSKSSFSDQDEIDQVSQKLLIKKLSLKNLKNTNTQNVNSLLQSMNLKNQIEDSKLQDSSSPMKIKDQKLISSNSQIIDDNGLGNVRESATDENTLHPSSIVSKSDEKLNGKFDLLSKSLIKKLSISADGDDIRIGDEIQQNQNIDDNKNKNQEKKRNKKNSIKRFNDKQGGDTVGLNSNEQQQDQMRKKIIKKLSKDLNIHSISKSESIEISNEPKDKEIKKIDSQTLKNECQHLDLQSFYKIPYPQYDKYKQNFNQKRKSSHAVTMGRVNVALLNHQNSYLNKEIEKNNKQLYDMENKLILDQIVEQNEQQSITERIIQQYILNVQAEQNQLINNNLTQIKLDKNGFTSSLTSQLIQNQSIHNIQQSAQEILNKTFVIITTNANTFSQKNNVNKIFPHLDPKTNSKFLKNLDKIRINPQNSSIVEQQILSYKNSKRMDNESSPQNMMDQDEKRLNYNSSHERSNKATGIGGPQQKISVMNIDESNVESSYQLPVRNTDINEQNIKTSNINLIDQIDCNKDDNIIRPILQSVALIKQSQNEIQISPSGISNKNVIVLTKDNRKSKLQLQENFNIFKNRDQVQLNNQIDNQQVIRGQTQLKITTKTSKKNSNIVSPIQTTPTSLNDISQSMLNYHQQSPVLTPQLIKKNQQSPQTKQLPQQNLIKGSTFRNQNSQMSKLMSIMKNKNESDQNKSQLKRSSQFQENGIVIGKKTGEKVIHNDYLKEIQLKPFLNANIQFQKEIVEKTIQEATQNGSEESRIHLTNQMIKNTSQPISSPMNNQRQSSLLDPRFIKMDSPQSIAHDDYEEEYNSIPTSHLMKTKIFMQKSSPANHKNQSQDFQIKKKILKSPINKTNEQFLVGSQNIVDKIPQKPKKKINLNDIVQTDKLSQKVYTSELSRRGDEKKDKFATINQVSMHNIPKIQNINVASDNESDDASQNNSSVHSNNQKQRGKPHQANIISPQSQQIHQANINKFNEMQKTSNMSTVVNEVHYRNQSPFIQSDFISFHKSSKIRKQIDSSANKHSRVQSLNIQKESSNIEKSSQQNDTNPLKSGSFQVNIKKDEKSQDLMQKCIVDVQLKLITEYTQKLIEQQLQQQNQVADAFKKQLIESISALQKVQNQQIKQFRNKNQANKKNQGLINRFSGKRNAQSVTPEPQKIRNQNSAKRHLKFINQVISQFGVINDSESVKKSLSPKNRQENQLSVLESNFTNLKENFPKIKNELKYAFNEKNGIQQKQKNLDKFKNQKNRSISTMATGLCIQVVGNKKKYEEILKQNSQNNFPENRQKISNESFQCSCGNYKSGNLSIQQNLNKEITKIELCKACLQNQSQNQELFHELMLNMWTGEQQSSPAKSQNTQAIKIENSGKKEVVGILGIKVVGKQFSTDQSGSPQNMRKSQNKNEIVIELNDKQKQLNSPMWPSQNTNKEENSQNIENLFEASNNQSINSAVVTPTAYPSIQPQIKNTIEQGTNSANLSQNTQLKYNDQNLVNYFNFKSTSHQPIRHNQKQILTSVLKNSNSRKQYKTQSQNINFQEIRNQTQPAVLPISAGFIQSAEGPDQQETFSYQKESFEGSLVEGKINRTRLIQNSQKTIKIFDNQIIAIKNQENVSSRQKNQFLIKENNYNNFTNFENNFNTERIASQLQKYSKNGSGIPQTDIVQSLYKNQKRKYSYISRPHTLGNTLDIAKIEEDNLNQIDKKDTLPINPKTKIHNNASALSANTPKPLINTLNSIWEDEGNKILTQLNPMQLTPAYQTNNNWEQVSSLFSQENIQSQIIQDINYSFHKGNPNIQLPIIQAQKLQNNQQQNFKNYQQLQLQQINLNQSQIVPGQANQNYKSSFKFSIQTSERRNMQLKINKQKKENLINTHEMSWIGGRFDSTPDERSAYNKTNTNFSIKDRGNSDFSTTHYPQKESNSKNMNQTYNQNFYKPPLKSMVQKKKITDLKLQAAFHK